MAIIGSVFAMLGRFAGRLLNAVLGWATLLLFGKVEGRKQTVMLLIALGSLAWIVVLLGILVPDVGTLLLAFVPVPDFVDENLVRLAMLGLAILIPLLIGVAAIYVTEAERRPKGAAIVTAILRGYPFTLVLALTIAILAVVSLVRKVRSLSKRWEDAHVPVVVKPGGYDRVLADLERVLDEAELPVHARPAPAVVSAPPRLLDAVAGRALGGLVPDRLMVLVGDDLEVLVYPSDVAISGTKAATARARAAIAVELTEAPAYMTTSAETEELEDAIREVAIAEGPSAPPIHERRRGLQRLDPKIARLTVPFDEWETVYRQRLQVERDLLAEQVEGLPLASGPDSKRPSMTERVVALGTLALLATDVALLVAERLRPPRRRR